MLSTAKVVLDLAMTLALGGDCLADIALPRAELALLTGGWLPIRRCHAPSTCWPPPAGCSPRSTVPRAVARAAVWTRAGTSAPNVKISADRPLIVDLDATLITAHSDKEGCGADVQTRVRHSTRCARSQTTGRPAPANRWRCCCGRAMPGPTPPLTTSLS